MSWLWTNIINPIWPNIAASVIWTLPALAWHHRRISARLDAHHERLREALGGGR